MNTKLENLSTAVRLVLVGIVIFSVIYPVLVGVGGQIWSNSVEGSPVRYENEIVGSELIGQDFENSMLFHGRPSSIDYNAMKSGSQNLAPHNPALSERVRRILKGISKSQEGDNLIVPSVLVTESGSALDPHITYRSAMFQVPRISKNTGIPENRLKTLVENHTMAPILGLYGLKRVNVLKLNIGLLELLEEEEFG